MIFDASWETLWRPVVEISILAVGIYFILMFVRRTHGWGVFIGFLVLLGVLVVTTALQLTVLNWMLLQLFSFSAYAILILFHPEIRRLLSRLGNLPNFSLIREQRETIEVIVQAVDRLSDVKIGALIAVEQSHDLSQVLELGVPIDCEATPEMLETIFFPNNAIHDGGVLIEGDRISHAACILPLTRRQDLQKSLGTRHRAAIGLSEETDAVVVLVSEETGMISYAHQGQLVRGLSVEELRSILSTLIVKGAKSEKRVEEQKDLHKILNKKTVT
ncbi:MAG: diadenylate cyclase CdaA [Limisphaerales bacterium]|nr:TIGR00159 family protein [Pedosphaera sp.]MBL6844240.1 TIGR00159 family protein [Verrucomicrobiae bacterium]HAR00071.1 TIGR00159 family protein [Verrucomicrobiales bacterium]HAW00863.1 TIGR00159 family protein [Verrucomicrobiales bacterium]HCP38289.1 TIGR00159 family protein [Verrucomicrobiales bacterium]|tara:strand:+ start:2470 stop:3291 length:822 start_codon:yes stop_codon:yes gene_type:complete